MVHNVSFQRFQDMDLVEQVHNFGLSNIHLFNSNISLIFNYAIKVCETPTLNTRPFNYVSSALPTDLPGVMLPVLRQTVIQVAHVFCQVTPSLAVSPGRTCGRWICHQMNESSHVLSCHIQLLDLIVSRLCKMTTRNKSNTL